MVSKNSGLGSCLSNRELLSRTWINYRTIGLLIICVKIHQFYCRFENLADDLKVELERQRVYFNHLLNSVGSIANLFLVLVRKIILYCYTVLFGLIEDLLNHLVDSCRFLLLKMVTSHFRLFKCLAKNLASLCSPLLKQCSADIPVLSNPIKLSLAAHLKKELEELPNSFNHCQLSATNISTGSEFHGAWTIDNANDTVLPGDVPGTVWRYAGVFDELNEECIVVQDKLDQLVIAARLGSMVLILLILLGACMYNLIAFFRDVKARDRDVWAKPHKSSFLLEYIRHKPSWLCIWAGMAGFLLIQIEWVIFWLTRNAIDSMLLGLAQTMSTTFKLLAGNIIRLVLEELETVSTKWIKLLDWDLSLDVSLVRQYSENATRWMDTLISELGDLLVINPFGIFESGIDMGSVFSLLFSNIAGFLKCIVHYDNVEKLLDRLDMLKHYNFTLVSSVSVDHCSIRWNDDWGTKAYAALDHVFDRVFEFLSGESYYYKVIMAYGSLILWQGLILWTWRVNCNQPQP